MAATIIDPLWALLYGDELDNKLVGGIFADKVFGGGGSHETCLLRYCPRTGWLTKEMGKIVVLIATDRGGDALRAGNARATRAGS